MQTALFIDNTAVAPGVTMNNGLIPQSRQDLLNLIYGNGGNRPATIVFHSDGGHGWLQVPHDLIKRMGIGSKITRYSYRDTNYAYLEEDCDLNTFVQALQIPQNNLMKEFWSVCPSEYADHSPIRNKRHY